MLQRILQGIRHFISDHIFLASVLSIIASTFTIISFLPLNGSNASASSRSVSTKPSLGPIFEEDCMTLHAKSTTISRNKIVVEVEGENTTSYPSLDYIFYCQSKNNVEQISDKIKTRETLYSNNPKQFKIICPMTPKNDKSELIITITKYLMTTTTSSCFKESSVELFPVKLDY